MKRFLTGIFISLTSIFFLLPGLSLNNALAFDGLRVTVEVVKADKAGSHVDPEIQDLVDELGPMFAYTGFTLIKKTATRLLPGQTDLSGTSPEHNLELSLLGFAEQRARLQVRILEKDQERLSTVLLLVDGGSAVIGGPAYEEGVMLLRISGEFF